MEQPFGPTPCKEPAERIGPMRSAAWLQTDASLPIWSCSVWGLPCRSHYWMRGALLPHLFTLTWIRCPRSLAFGDRGGTISRRYAFCGTSRPRAFTPASRTLSGTLPCGVRTFLPRTPPIGEIRQRPPGPPASVYFSVNSGSPAAVGNLRWKDLHVFVALSNYKSLQ